MKKINAELKENEYIRNDVLTTQFTMLVEDAVKNHPKFQNINLYEYIHGFIKYPRWVKDADLFSAIDEHNLQRLQNDEIYFILDASTEGYSSIYQVPFFDILHYNCEKYNVNPEKIIFVSANLLDEQIYDKWCKDKNFKKIKIFSFNFFEKVAESPSEWNTLIENGIDILPKVTLEKIKIEVENNFKDKYFSSLSRLNRHQRSVATFLLCQHPISNRALISHDKLKIDNPDSWLRVSGLHEFSVETFNNWLESLPRVVDYENFNVNWAIGYSYAHIHHRTLFQIVNETYQSDFYQTSLFYSEKTFRPMICMQPFIIYGQPGINKYLKKIGYMTYEDWFDLSFDDEPNDTIRYRLILDMVDKLCNKFDSMSRREQISWRFQREDVLMYNFKVMKETAITKNKIINFLAREIYDIAD